MNYENDALEDSSPYITSEGSQHWEFETEIGYHDMAASGRPSSRGRRLMSIVPQQLRALAPRRSRRSGQRRAAFTTMALTAGLLMPTVVLGQAATASAAAGPVTHACLQPGAATTALASLFVESSAYGSTTAPYASTIAAGDRVTEFKWLVNLDNTGDPAANANNAAACLPARAKSNALQIRGNRSLALYAKAGTLNLDGCVWPSMHAVKGNSPVVASGDQTQVGNLRNLPAGRYLVSVTAPNYKIDGVHFEVRAGAVYSVNEEVGKPFVVRMNPLPKKTTTLRIHVYNDNASTNSQWDGQTETLITCDDATTAQRIAHCGGANVKDPNIIADPSTDMAGFTVQITDVLNPVTTDVYGNPLCTEYVTDASGNTVLDGDGAPIPLTFANGGASGSLLVGTESSCISDHFGDIVIPNLGPNRYAATVIAPDPRTHGGEQWIQTTTLEGGHDWDMWQQEGETGYDTELMVGGERVTPVAHGFVKLTNNDQVWHDAEAAAAAGNTALEHAYYDASAGFNAGSTPGTGVLKGRIREGHAFIASGGGLEMAGTNLANAKDYGPITDGIVSVACIATCSAPTDQVVWTGRARAADGSFEVTGLQSGDYTIALWDETQSFILATVQYHVESGKTTDMGDNLLYGWFTMVSGVVFNDLNGNGVRDAGEPGVPGFPLTIRTRGNSLQDQGASKATTNEAGEYDLTQAYPLNQFLILEGYNPRYKNTGYTYQADNDPVAHTILTSQVDFNFLPVFGNSVNIEIGVQAYGTGTDYWSGTGAAPANENGGIVGTVTYDVTRNELDPAYSAQEDYQPGIPGIPMQLWKTHKTDGVHPDTYSGSGALQQWGISADGTECMRPDTSRGSNAVTDSTQTCKPFDYYVTESWNRPTGCVALDINGNPLKGEMVLPDAPAVADPSHSDPNNPDCIEAPMAGVQVGGDGTVDGNYALNSLMRASTLASAIASGTNLEQVYADSQNNPANSDPITNGDYVVEAVNPIDTVNSYTTTDPAMGGNTANGTANRLYKFTHEDSVNIFTGDTYVPQDGFVGNGTQASGGITLDTTTKKHQRTDNNSLSSGQVAKCAGSLHLVGSNNPDFTAGGGSPFLGENRPICDSKLVTVAAGRSVNPTFFMYTDVPIPSRFFGLIIDDLNVETNRRGTYLGEMAPVSNAPVTIFDENGNWKYTSHSDPNGNYEVLLPSMDTYNCPLPAGPCPNLYRLVGNDPGSLAHRNTDYNPQYKVISTTFQAWAGVIHPVDQAPTHNGITIEPTGVNGPTGLAGPSAVTAFSVCQLANNQPTLYTIDKPFFDPATDGNHLYTIVGTGFGPAPQVTITGGRNAGGTRLNLRSASNTQVTFVLPNNLNPGPYQIIIRNVGSGLTTVNGLTFHRLAPVGQGGRNTGANYLTRNDVYEVTPSIVRDNPGARQFTPMMDAWDQLTDSPAGFSGVSKYGDTVSGGRAIQRAIDAAHDAEYVGTPNTPADGRPKMVVVYPNTADNYASHNAFAAYYENLIMRGRVRIQGVGPGSDLNSATPVQGTTIDASQFWSSIQVVPKGANPQATDGSYSIDWLTYADSLDNIMKVANNPEGSAVLAIAEYVGQWNSTTSLFKPGVDGILFTGGDAKGTLNQGAIVPGAAEPAGVVQPGAAQGGAVTLDTYVTDFQLTNNLVEANNGAYGVIRVGTPDVTNFVPELGTVGDHPTFTGSMHNERFNLSYNRIIANSGTNRAGAVGLYNGADNYLIANNDFCGNFSAEYGGAITHYGEAAGGVIRRNRIYFNQAYGEGGGIMIAGELPANNNTLSAGAGRGTGTTAAVSGVLIDSNNIVSNQANDDGGGIRFLMAGNFPFTLQNNIIAGNISTHAGGGVALDDAPNVTVVNNTIAKNITTGTAITNSAGLDGIKPANPAGLSTGGNSALLQATLLPSAPNWSKPTLINNLFADNRAAWSQVPTATNFNVSGIMGIGQDGDTNPIQRWDIGVLGADSLNNGLDANNNIIPLSLDTTSNTTNTVASAGLQHAAMGAVALAGDLNNNPAIDGAASTLQGGVGFINEQEQGVDSVAWRRNTAVQYPVLMTQLMPASLGADYHLAGDASRTLAVNDGVAPSANRLVPTYDIDGQQRPLTGLPERGADEITGVVTTDLSIIKSDNVTTVHRGDVLTYNITVTNQGPDNATGARVQDVPPATLGSVSWTCTDSLLSFCPAASGTGPLNQLVNIANNDYLTFTVTATVLPTARNGSSIRNTATVTRQPGANEPVLTDNTAVDTDTVVGSTVDVSVTKTDNTTTVHPGALDTYTVTVSNAGPNLASGVTVTDTLPATLQGVTWTCSASAGSSCGAVSGARSINQQVTVAPGGTVTFLVTAGVAPSATPNSTITNTARAVIAAGDTDTNPANNSATDVNTVVTTVDLRVTKDDGVTSVARGTATTYTITVKNLGPDPAMGVRIIDAAPVQLRNVRWTCVSSGGATCGGGGNAGNPNGSASGTGSILRTVNVPVGGLITITVTGTVIANTVIGASISNTVTAVPVAGVTQLMLGGNLANDLDTVR